LASLASFFSTLPISLFLVVRIERAHMAAVCAFEVVFRDRPVLDERTFLLTPFFIGIAVGTCEDGHANAENEAGL
jgi:hypothetical protein